MCDWHVFINERITYWPEEGSDEFGRRYVIQIHVYFTREVKGREKGSGGEGDNSLEIFSSGDYP